MSQETETVEQVCEKMKEPSIYKGRFPASFFDGEFCAFAIRILAAHKREIAAKDAEILSLKSKIDEYERQPELMADVAKKQLALIKRQDAKIASLKSLIKELADILKITSRNYFECEERMCVFCGKKCGRNEATRLINEAREACK